jgi:hypothetical protein
VNFFILPGCFYNIFFYRKLDSIPDKAVKVYGVFPRDINLLQGQPPISSLQQSICNHRNSGKTYRKKMRCLLSADTLYARIHENFAKVRGPRANNSSISLPDALMSGFAMFRLKDPSLLAFEKCRHEEPDSLHEVYGIPAVFPATVRYAPF